MGIYPEAYSHGIFARSSWQKCHENIVFSLHEARCLAQLFSDSPAIVLAGFGPLLSFDHFFSNQKWPRSVIFIP
jgi:hypothetical protein